MLQSMYSGISGMSASNQQLNVISNNIGNSQTTAFNSSSVTFEDMFSQTVQASTAPTGSSGGINASQVGTGTKVQSINKNMNAGSNQATGRALDNCISGNGFFILGRGTIGTGITVDQADHSAKSTTGTELDYSRDGSFSLDAAHNIVNAGGSKLMGYALKDGTTTSIDDSGATTKVNFVASSATVTAADTNLVPLVIPETIDGSKVSSYGIDQNGIITATLADKRVAAIGQIALASFANDSGLNATGNNMYSVSTNSGSAVLKSGIGDTANNNSEAFGTILSGVLQASNVDLATEFTHMIEASKAFQASGKIITTGDTILQTIINLKQ